VNIKQLAAVALILLSIGAALAPASADQGREIYEQKCGRCHVLYEPASYSASDWPGIVRIMRAEAALTEQEMEEITAYLVRESGEGGGGLLSGGPVVGGYLYAEYFETPEEKKNYDIHYLAISLSGWANDRISYLGEFELEHGGRGNDTFVEQAYIDYWMLPNVALKIGAFLTPFNRFDEFHDPLANYVITRPQVSRELGVSAWKEVGADLHGFANLTPDLSVFFDLYTINGLGEGANLRGSRQYRDNNEDKAFGGRVSLLYGDMMELGGSVYQGDYDDAGKLNLTQAGGHLMVRTSGVELYGEYLTATSENLEPVKDGEMDGFFVQVSRLFKSKYRPTVRYGVLDYLDEGTEFGRDPAKGNKDLSELILGFSYYPTSKVAYKIEYGFFDEGDRVEEKDNDQLSLQAAVRF